MVIGPHSIINQPILAMTKPGSAPYNGLYGEASLERVSILGFKYRKCRE